MVCPLVDQGLRHWWTNRQCHPNTPIDFDLGLSTLLLWVYAIRTVLALVLAADHRHKTPQPTHVCGVQRSEKFDRERFELTWAVSRAVPHGDETAGRTPSDDGRTVDRRRDGPRSDDVSGGRGATSVGSLRLGVVKNGGKWRRGTHRRNECDDMDPFREHLALGQVFADRARRGALFARDDAQVVILIGVVSLTRDGVMSTPGQSVQPGAEHHDRAVQDGHQPDQESGKASARHRQVKDSREVEIRGVGLPSRTLCSWLLGCDRRPS